MTASDIFHEQPLPVLGHTATLPQTGNEQVIIKKYREKQNTRTQANYKRGKLIQFGNVFPTNILAKELQIG